MKPSKPNPAHTSRPLLRLIAWMILLLVASTAPSLARLSAEEADAYYRQGQDALAEGRYTEAAEQFRALSREDGAQVDRALYWQAYAESKAGRSKAALRTLERLADGFPDSSWLDDARALELELGGIEVETAMQSNDEELKLYALDALTNAEPDRAVELIGDFLRGQHPHRLKRHALFILAQTESPRADEILAQMAGDTLLGLHREAIQALGVRGGTTAEAALETLYHSHDDRETKIIVLHALLTPDFSTLAAKFALEETDPDLRDEAIRMLGAMEATSELERVSRELGPSARLAVFQAYGIADQPGPLLRVLRESSDPDELEDAIEAMVIADDGDDARDTMLALYRSTPERRIQERVLDYLMIQDDAEALIQIFREEDDPDMKRRALQSVSHIDDPRVQSLLEELLKG